MKKSFITFFIRISFAGDPKPLITWSTENGSPIEAMVLAGYRYTPEIKDGNKTLHLVSNPLKKTDREEVSSKCDAAKSDFSLETETLVNPGSPWR